MGIFNIDEKDSVAIVTMSRPPVNAINDQFMDELGILVDEIEDRDDLNAVVFRSDQRVFCAGADLPFLKKVGEAKDSERLKRRFVTGLRGMFERIERLPCLTIAQIEGAALGGGYELALCFDLRIAAHEAKIGLPEARHGLIPGAGGTQRLTRLCGRDTAARIILTADMVDGAEAERLGMVTWSAPAADVGAVLDGLLARVRELSAFSIRTAKACIHGQQNGPLAGAQLEINGSIESNRNPDTQRRLAAFSTRKK
ncbi:MAG: enoyl-CoA hydratase/isomerase family protein [Alphaproteobacteria bacterium]